MNADSTCDRCQDRRTALLFLVVAGGLVALLLNVAINQPIGAPRRNGQGDVDLYRAIIERVRSGEAYYSILADELPRRGYPTASPFNWRTPLPMWLIGILPSGTAKGLLIAIAVSAVLLSYRAMRHETNFATAVLCAWLTIGALLPCVLGDLFVMPVVWSGTLILLSLGLLASNSKLSGIIAGVAALFFRDLALVYVTASMLVAAQERRWREAAAWATGLAMWAGFFAVHVSHVASHMPPDAVAHESSWVRFGGAAFLIGICQMNLFLLVRPAWLSALYLAAVLLGGFGWLSAWGRRVTWVVLAYLLAFAVVGQPFNQYWGSLVAPLFCIPAARFPGVVANMARKAAPQKAMAPSPVRS